jgi:hypothetical protein
MMFEDEDARCRPQPEGEPVLNPFFLAFLMLCAMSAVLLGMMFLFPDGGP